MLHDLDSAMTEIKSKSVNSKTKNSFKKKFKKNAPFLLMLSPGLLVLLINNYLPMAGVVIAFERFRYADNFISSFFTSKWVNFDNFKFLFQSPDVLEATRNTILYNLLFIFLDLVIPVALAIALSEMINQRRSKLYQSAAFLPYFMSWMIVAYLAYAMFQYKQGVINNVLTSIHMSKINWYFDLKAWPYILTSFQLWKYTGYNIVVFLATISGISGDYYEAAVLDGASKWQQIKYITLPMLKTVMIIVTLLAIGRIFNSDFGLFFNVPMNQGQLYPVAQTIDTYVYNAMIHLGNPSMTAAAGLYQAVCGCITVFIANLVVRKIDKDQALF